MAKSTTTSKNSNTIKTRSSSSSTKAGTTKPFVSKSKAKGRKVRDRKDVEGMNGLNAIGDLQATLSSGNKRKLQQTPATQQVRFLVYLQPVRSVCSADRRSPIFARAFARFLYFSYISLSKALES